MHKLTLTSLIVLASCTIRAPINTPPVEVTKSSSFQFNGLSGFSDTEIRTRKASDKTEMFGVTCFASSTGYIAELQTPAIVNLPTYGTESPTVSVSCTYNGITKVGRATLYNYSVEQRNEGAQNAAATGLLVGAAVSSAVNGARDGDTYKYRLGWFEF